MLIRAIVVHHPEFLGTPARTDEGDLRGTDAGQPAHEPRNDFVGELVGILADLRVGWASAINFADHRLVRWAAHVEAPRGNGHLRRGFGNVSESEKICV